jgi:hypothetical protein
MQFGLTAYGFAGTSELFPDYASVVATPMDLATIQSRVQSHQYSCLEDFKRDVGLIFSNCVLYNSRVRYGASVAPPPKLWCTCVFQAPTRRAHAGM